MPTAPQNLEAPAPPPGQRALGADAGASLIKLVARSAGGDLEFACFPAGTVSGAPKIRAMEIIDELETERRGIYAGSIAYLDFWGNLDSCIAIRTIVKRKDRYYLQAGAGIVADSKPLREFRETEAKARALMEAVAGNDT